MSEIDNRALGRKKSDYLEFIQKGCIATGFSGVGIYIAGRTGAERMW